MEASKYEMAMQVLVQVIQREVEELCMEVELGKVTSVQVTLHRMVWEMCMHYYYYLVHMEIARVKMSKQSRIPDLGINDLME